MVYNTYSLTLLVLFFIPIATRAGEPPRSAADRPGATLTDQQRDYLAKAWRQERAGWHYLHIEGPPAERGFQHGYLLAQEIAECLRVEKTVWEYRNAVEWSWLVGKGAAMFVPRIDAENLAEIDGIVAGMRAAGVETSREEMVAYNGIIELAHYWYPMEKERRKDDRPTGKGDRSNLPERLEGCCAQIGVAPSSEDRKSCSALIATGSATADGRIVLAHNTMGGYAGSPFFVILDVQPSQGRRILMQAAPGWIHSGTDFFVTDAGLVGAETTISGFKGFDEQGIPEFVRMRRAVQDASSIDQWCAIMKRGNNGGYANAWLVGDIKTNEIARLELGLKAVNMEKKRDGYFLGCNRAEDVKLLRQDTSFSETDIRLSPVARRVRGTQLIQQALGRIDLEFAQRFLADHYDAYLERDVPGGRSLCSHDELVREPHGRNVPFSPAGTVDGKVVDEKLARQMAFVARWGSACGRPFDAEQFFAAHPQFEWMQGLLKSRPSQPWTVFRAGVKD